MLAGAGVSIEEPSGIPAAWGLLEALLKWVAPGRKVRAALARRMTPGSHFNPYQFLRFEGFIQAVAEIDPNIFSYLESTQTFGGPNINHQMLASMALEGATVLTTNFDTRIEQAAGQGYLPAFVLSSKRRAPNPPHRLIKLHGSFPWRRGRNVTPRATLTQIGKLGLGFEHFPAFQNWFRKATSDKHLIVVGYSASDSFDVVPLVEEYSNAKTVIWFSHHPDQRGLRVSSLRPRKSRDPFPFERSVDFAAHALEHLSARPSRPCEVYRVYGAAVQTLLKGIVRLPEDVRPSKSSDVQVAARNLAALRTTLAENALTVNQRRTIFRLLDDGVFGESYATAVEAKPVRRGKQVIFVESNKRFARGSAEGRAHAAFQEGKPDLAFRILEDAASKGADRDQILLLLHHFEFRFGERGGDVPRLDRAVRKAERVSRRSGVLWGLIIAEWMKSFRLEVEWRAAVHSLKKKNELARAILAHAERAVYYGVRAGCQMWFAATARLAAKHLVNAGESDESENLLTNLLMWLDRETPDGVEETATTACALNTLGIRSGQPDIVNAARRILSGLDARICPVVKLLRIAAEAEVAHDKRQWRRFARLERSAKEHILKLDPADQWGVRDVLDYLRQAAIVGKESHARD